MRWVSFKDVINKMWLEIIYIIRRYKKDLALNNNGWYTIKRNETKPNLIQIYMSFNKVLNLRKVKFLADVFFIS